MADSDDFKSPKYNVGIMQCCAVCNIDLVKKHVTRDANQNHGYKLMCQCWFCGPCLEWLSQLNASHYTCRRCGGCITRMVEENKTEEESDDTGGDTSEDSDSENDLADEMEDMNIDK